MHWVEQAFRCVQRLLSSCTNGRHDCNPPIEFESFYDYQSSPSNPSIYCRVLSMSRLSIEIGRIIIPLISAISTSPKNMALIQGETSLQRSGTLT